MFTPDEIAAVELFASLAPAERERLARVAADVTLLAGEYAAHEGGERALFAVIEGADRGDEARRRDRSRRRPTSSRRGVRRVPITLGTVFPVGFRAAERSRIMRVEPADYHAVVAVVPALGAEVGRLAANRIAGPRGLRGIAAAPPPPRAIVVGHRWDPACAELRRFLDRNQVSFRWVTPDSPDAAEEWGATLPDERDCPVIRVIDGKVVVRPQLRRVAELLGLGTEADAPEYDAVIVGAGPAGLAAGVYGASEGLQTIVVEREAPGGQAGTSSRIENYLGFPDGLSGDELASRALKQARRLGAEILVTRAISRIDPATRQVHLDGGDVLRARTIILACGVAWRQLSIEGFDRLAGKGVFYGAARSEAAATHGLDVHIVGAGNSAGQAAMFFATHARCVTILCRGDTLEKSMSRYLVDQILARPNIRVLYRTEVASAHGEASLEAIEVRDAKSGETSRLDSAALFIFIGADAETDWLPPEIALDRHGFVLTGSELRAAERWELERDPYLLETSVPGIFACGDVRSGPVKRVASAVGEGSMAIAFVHQFLREAAAAAPEPATAGRAT